MKRGEQVSVYTNEIVVVVWKDNQPVYMASNCEDVLPGQQCHRFSAKDKRYVLVPQPALNRSYNQHMGRVDLLDGSVKCYSIQTRIRKWYWCLYTWFLGVSMVQAWRKYRQVMKDRHIQEREEAQQKQLEKEEQILQTYTMSEVHIERKEWEAAQKKRRAEQKKLEEISQLDFIRQVVELMIKNYGKGNTTQAFPSVSNISKAHLRFDGRGHLVKMSTKKGVCQLCKKRTFWRCVRCDVALHCECFYSYHVNENE